MESHRTRSLYPTCGFEKIRSKEKRVPSPEISITTTPPRQSAAFISTTPGNVDQISQIDDLISCFRLLTLDTPKLALLSKLIRGAKVAMPDRGILNATNEELYEDNVRKKKRGNRTGKQHDAQGARHLGLEEIEQRRQYAASQQRELEDKQAAKNRKRGEAELAKACKELMRFGPDLLGLPLKKSAPAVPTPKPVHKTPEKLANTQRKKRKSAMQRHVRFEGVPVKKGREKVADRVSSRGRMIYRRCKS